MSAPPRKYADLKWYDALHLVAIVLPLPAILFYTALVGRHTKNNKNRSLKRVIAESAFRYGLTHLNIPQVQFIHPSSMAVYQKWTKQVKLAPVIDDLDDDAKLLWIAPKRTERVILYLHGGCYVLPLTDFELDFIRCVQLELEKQDIQVGIAVLQYSLAPTVSFPTPLKQAVHALNFLLASGVNPENIQIIGDSSGGNLSIQLLSQILHPLSSVPSIHPPTPIRGLCLISPWASLTTEAKSFEKYDGIDTMTPYAMRVSGAEILAGVPKSDLAFAEPAKAPNNWFKGADTVIERVLVTAGGVECMRDDITKMSQNLKANHPDVELFIQEGGLHDDLLLDYMVKENKIGILMKKVLDWLTAGFKA